MEIWKEIKGFEGFYEVSNLGRVRSMDRIIKTNIGFRKDNKQGLRGLMKRDNRYISKFTINKQRFEKSFNINKLGEDEAKKQAIEFINKNNTNMQIKLINGKLTPQQLNNKGYFRVTLCKGNKKYYKFVHRLVLDNFIENIHNKPLCNHKNGIKTDNRVSNLEWCTQSENMKHMFRILKVKPYGKKIRCEGLNKIFDSSYDAGRYINIILFNNTKKVKNISKQIRRYCDREDMIYGYKWKHVD
jgi:hypothetical protein